MTARNNIRLCVWTLLILPGWLLTSASTIQAGQVGAWLFDSGTTTTPELGGKSELELVLGGNATFNSKDTPLEYAGNRSLEFTQASQNDNARADDSTSTSFQPNQKFSVQVWFKCKEGRDTQQIVSKRKQASGDGYALGIATNKKVYWFVQGGSETRTVLSDSTADDSKWHFAVGIYDPMLGLRLYVDGVEQSKTDGALSAEIKYENARFAIGTGRDASSGNYNPFVGLVDDVAIFDEVRSAEQIEADFKSGLKRKGSSPNSK
jgi:Concanavalin A-like lectin/glucanases superfamily